ncbi:MFS transporter [Corynebacterium glutamicum]|uniref:MFS transporter n=1 Tax=Corynebacterium glutamicum TaxID=1718 RepID=UPI001B8D6E35|nr:MFS transporter [Corynebacterium glutamicum]
MTAITPQPQNVESGSSKGIREKKNFVPGIPMAQLRSGAIGNLIEWFDWNAYALLSVYFAAQFFPAGTSPLVALLGSFGIMAVGFIVRPLAGLAIGVIADRFGRKTAMLITVYGMGVASLMIALSPTYAQIGIFAPLILLLARIIQGICIGGEYAALTAFAMEMAPNGKRGLVAAILNIVANFGQILVVVIILAFSWSLPDDAMHAWGWRLVFIIGALLSLLGIWMRRDMKETIDVETSRAKKESVFAAVKRYPRQTIQIIGLTAGFTAMVYAWGAYMPTYAATYKGFDPKYSIMSMGASFAVAMVSTYFAGKASDRFGRKPTMIIAGILLSVGTVPALTLLNDSVWTLIIIQSVGLSIIGMLQSSSMPVFAEMFPSDFRASGLGFPYALTVGLIGGTVPLVGTQLANMDLTSVFPWYLTALIVISTLFYIGMKETAFKPLPK